MLGALRSVANEWGESSYQYSMTLGSCERAEGVEVRLGKKRCRQEIFQTKPAQSRQGAGPLRFPIDVQVCKPNSIGLSAAV